MLGKYNKQVKHFIKFKEKEPVERSLLTEGLGGGWGTLS